MAFTEVTSESWFSRIGKSFGGIIFGIILFMLAIGGLWWNEGRAVKTEQALKEGAASVVSLEAPIINNANDGKLVHLSGKATTTATLGDPQFGVEIQAIKLKRRAEMFQWREESKSETRTKVGGGTETVKTYTYEKVWSEDLLDSSNYKDAGHDNPSSMPVSSEVFTATPVTVGDFTLSDGLITQISKFDPVPPPASLPAGYKAVGQVLFKSSDPNSPAIGDLRVTFSAAMPADVSIVAAQYGKSLSSYAAKNGTPIEMLDYGNVPAATMFAQAQDANKMMTWIIRLAGLLALFIGCQLVLAPVGVLADVLPFLGSIARLGTSLISIAVSIPVAFLTIALAWIVYRPIIGIALLLVGIIIPVAVIAMRKRKTVPAGATAPV